MLQRFTFGEKLDASRKLRARSRLVNSSRDERRECEGVLELGRE